MRGPSGAGKLTGGITPCRTPTPGSTALPPSSAASTLPSFTTALPGAGEHEPVLRHLPTVYVLDRQQQDERLARLSEAGTEGDGWTRLYRDSETGERWVLYYPRSEQHGGGLRVLRRGDVPEDRAGWAVALLRDGTEADVVGSALDLSNEPEAWAAVLDRIEAERASLRLERVRAFVERLGVLQPMNRRPVIGKSAEEIAADAAHFQELTRRAAVLAGAVEPASAADSTL